MFDNKVGFYKFNEFVLDLGNSQLLRDGVPVSITQKSFEILCFLVENHGRILKKEEFLGSLWEGSFVEEANLTQHIYMLRKILRQNGSDRKYIETIPKNGYRFIAKVEDVTDHQNENPLRSDGVPSENASVNGRKEFALSENGFDSPNRSSDSGSGAVNAQRSHPRKSYNFLALFLIVVFTALSTAGYIYFTNGVNFARGGDLEKKSIAVLPFRQIDGNKDAKLGIGIADVLIARLANIEEIAVRPTTSIIRFSGKNRLDLFEIGNKLGVDCVIEGAIQRDKNVVRVTTQLYDVKQKRTVWTEKFDEEYSDIFTLQDKISERIAQRISRDLKGKSEHLLYKQYTKNIGAYKDYSMGLAFWKMHTRVGFTNAIRFFESAIEKDVDFVMAYAYLADAYGHTGHISHLLSPEEARKKGEAAAKKALQLDPNSAEALASLALIYANTDKQTKAFELMKESIKIKPNDSHSRHRISWMYANKGQIEKAVDEMKIARALDPKSAYLNLFLGEMLILADRPEEAKTYLNKALEIEPGSFMAKWRYAEALEHQGFHNAAEKKLLDLQKKVGDSNKGVRLALSRVYAKNNKEKEAREILKSVLSEGDSESLNSLVAMTYIALGEEELAVRQLKPVVKSIQDNIYRLKYEPNIDPIRSNPKFEKLLREKETSQGW